ncbi:MAG: hypothetical protein KKD00_11200, partial [Gammaproteobacteria bacterium]|nr:hypothetical protein [Gammaproteobacteria bacterium]
MKHLKLAVTIVAFMVFSVAAWGFAFNNGSPKWQGASTLVYTGIPGTSRSGIPWSTAMQQAAQQWNDKTQFEFEISSEYRDPCTGTGSGSRPDYLNGADFGNTICGNTISNSTLAVTVYFQESNILGSADIVEADIIFNSNLSFDVY